VTLHTSTRPVRCRGAGRHKPHALESLGVGVILGILGTLAGHPAHAALWQRAQSGTDLWYSGFLHAEASYTDVTGSVYEYEEGYFHGRENGSIDAKGSLHAHGLLRTGLAVDGTMLFDTRYDRYPQRYWDRRFWDTFRMNVVMDTPQPVNDRWRLHARATYDREDSWRNEYPDARLLMEPIDDARLEVHALVESHSLLFEGGDLKPDFGGRGFVLYQRDILGLRANAHNDAAEGELIGGRTKGTTFLQTPDDSLGIRADGTAGPYRLAHAPIVRGSEIVAIEERDRFDATIRVRRTEQRRNVDYTVDYLRGVITFMEPIASESFESNPIYISIQYAFDDRSAGYRRYLAAGRAGMKWDDTARADIIYSGIYDDPGSWQGDDTARPPADRRSNYGTVIEVEPLARTRIEASAALSDSGQYAGESHNGAVGLNLESRSVPNLTLNGDFQHIEPGFVALDNRTLVGQRNRQELRLDGTYRAAESIDLLGGGRHTRTAVEALDANAYRDQSVFAGVRLRPLASTELTYRQEWRTAEDRKPVHERDELRETGSLELGQAFATSRLRAAAEREHFTDHAHAGQAGARTATWRLRGALDLSPWSWLAGRGAAKTELLKDTSTDHSQSRRDRAEAGATLRFGDAYSLRGDLEWKVDRALDAAGWQFTGGTRTNTERAHSLGADLRPAKSVQLLLAYDREEMRNDLAALVERAAEAFRVEGHWFLTPDLELHGVARHEDLRDARKIGVAQGLLRRYERGIEGDITYNYLTRLSLFTGYQLKLRRVFDPGRSDTKLHRVRTGANYHIHRDWEITARLSYALLDGEPIAAEEGMGSLAVGEAIDNRRWVATGELAWDIGHMWRLAAGYEALEHEVTDGVEPQDGADDDYAANRFFLKLMQKF
jgi:hypothetical protein